MNDMPSSEARRRLLKKIGVGTSLFCAILATSDIAVAQGLPGPDKVATAFLTILATRGADAAWLAASPDFRNVTSRQKWAAYVRASALDLYRSASWTPPRYSGRNALVVGTVTISTGATMPAKVQLEKTAAGWRVSRVDLKLAGAAYQAVQHLPG